MILPGSYANGFAPRDGQPLYPELWRGCVGAWNPGLGPTGLTLRDWSGFGNHGTLTNMDAGSDWVVSQGRYALDFDGVNDKVQFGTTRLPSGGSARTIAVWVYQTSYSNYVVPFSFGGLTALNAFGVIIAGAGGYVPGMINGNLVLELNERTIWSGISTVPLNKWSHLSVVCPSSAINVVQLYIDGFSASVSFNNPAGTLNTTAVNPMMGAYLDNWYSQPALFADLQVYNRALSPSEIRLLASRRGIAYEMAPRRRASSAVQFNRRRRLLIGASS